MTSAQLIHCTYIQHNQNATCSTAIQIVAK